VSANSAIFSAVPFPIPSSSVSCFASWAMGSRSAAWSPIDAGGLGVRVHAEPVGAGEFQQAVRHLLKDRRGLR
jgi:hypothetical protein